MPYPHKASPSTLEELPAAVFELERNEPREERGGIELTDDRLEVAQTTRERMNRHNIAIAG